jgi:CubicO group peptidase (beta-lactamase class C family)
MRTWKVPGLAVAVVHKGQVIMARGYSPVASRNLDNTSASGGINSNVRDLARWLQSQL